MIVPRFDIQRCKKRFSSGSTTEDNNNIISTSSNKLDIFKDKPFWISDIERHKAEDIRIKDIAAPIIS
jgi:hypothetical protein